MKQLVFIFCCIIGFDWVFTFSQLSSRLKESKFGKFMTRKPDVIFKGEKRKIELKTQKIASSLLLPFVHATWKIKAIFLSAYCCRLQIRENIIRWIYEYWTFNFMQLLLIKGWLNCLFLQLFSLLFILMKIVA